MSGELGCAADEAQGTGRGMRPARRGARPASSGVRDAVGELGGGDTV